jgi:hypothetical protein
MGLDVKEKALLQFIAKVTVPLALILAPLVVYTGIWEHPLWAVGVFTVAVQAIKLLKYLLERLSRRPKRVTTYGQWAIVTGEFAVRGALLWPECVGHCCGLRNHDAMMVVMMSPTQITFIKSMDAGATSGIGEAFAHELAKRGMSLLIISRSQDKLERVRSEIQQKSAPGAQVEILAHDFTKGGAEADAFYARLGQVAGVLDGKGGVGMLINNVGVNVEVPEFFHDLAEDQIQDIVRVNVESTVRMTRTILPLMAKRCVLRAGRDVGREGERGRGGWPGNCPLIV